MGTLATNIVANHITWSPKKLNDGVQESAFDVGEIAHHIVQQITHCKTMRVLALPASWTVVTFIVFSATHAVMRLHGVMRSLSSTYLLDVYGTLPNTEPEPPTSTILMTSLTHVLLLTLNFEQCSCHSVKLHFSHSISVE